MWAVQAYKYIQRPAAPMQAAEQGSVPYMPGTRVISGQPIGMGGRARLSTFPAFPTGMRTYCCSLIRMMGILHSYG